MELSKLIKLKKLIFFYLLNLQALLWYIFIFFNKLMNIAPTSITKFFLFLKYFFFFDPSFFYFYILSFFSFFPVNPCLFLHWFILLYFVLFYIYIFFFIFFIFFLLCIVKAIKPINPKKNLFFLKQLNLWLI